MAYIGSTPTSQNFISGTDYFSGTGSQTAYTLTRTVNSVNDIEVVINNVVQQPSTAYTLSGTTITFTSAPSSGTNNIYVRYLATNMQSFTVPANSITRTQLDSNLQAGFQGRNKIINGHMLIDQRGATGVPSNAGYTLDRWQALQSGGGAYSVQQSSVAPAGFSKSLLCTVTTTDTSFSTSDYYFIDQLIEGNNVSDLGWGTADAKTVTVSFWVRSSVTGLFGGSLMNAGWNRSYPFSYAINVADTWEQKSVTITGDTAGTWLTTNGIGIRVIFGFAFGSNYVGTGGAWTASEKYTVSSAVNWLATSGNTFYLTGVQLEEGTTATSFERESYSVTEMKCKRYCNRLDYGNGGAINTGYVDSSTSARGGIVFPPMRTSASASASSATHFKLDNGAGAYVGTGISFDGLTTTSARLILNSSGMTSGQGGIFLSVNSSAYILLTAEL